VAHFGIAMTLFGIVCQTWASERIVALKPNEARNAVRLPI